MESKHLIASIPPPCLLLTFLLKKNQTICWQFSLKQSLHPFVTFPWLTGSNSNTKCCELGTHMHLHHCGDRSVAERKLSSQKFPGLKQHVSAKPAAHWMMHWPVMGMNVSRTRLRKSCPTDTWCNYSFVTHCGMKANITSAGSAEDCSSKCHLKESKNVKCLYETKSL